MMARGAQPSYGVRRPWRFGQLIEGVLVLAAGVCTVASAAGFVWIFLLNDPDSAPSADTTADLDDFSTAAGPADEPTPAAAPAPPTTVASAGPTATGSSNMYALQGEAPLLRLPDRSASAKRTLQKGQTVERVGQIENWMLVRIPGVGGADVSGWVETRHLAVATN